MLIPLSYNLRSLMARKATTLATAGGIGLVVLVLAGSSMLAAGVERALVSSGRSDSALILRLGADAELASNLEQKHLGLVLASPGVKRDETGQPLGSGEMVAVVALDIVGQTEGQISNVTVRGVDANVMKLRPEVRVVDGRPAQPGTDEVIIGSKIRGRFKGVDLGKTFDLRKNRPLTVVGVFESGGSNFESEIWADIDTVRTSFGREGLLSSITVRLESPAKYDAFAQVVESDKQLGLQSMRESDYYRKQSAGLAFFLQVMGTAIAIFFAIGAMIGAMITMYGAVSQRRREIGTLRALGFSRFAILFSFLFEALALSVVGGLLGVLGALAVSNLQFSMVNPTTWSEVVFTFQPTVGSIIGSLVAGGIMGIIGGFLPAIRAARTSAIEAMRG